MFSKSILIISIILFIFSLAAVSANDLNNSNVVESLSADNYSQTNAIHNIKNQPI